MPARDYPPDFAAALAEDGIAGDLFAGLAPSHQREYLGWIAEAKTAPTRQRRIAATLDRLKNSETTRRNGQT